MASKPTTFVSINTAELAEKKNLPPIYLSCGEQDGLYAANCRLDEHLKSLGIAHRFDHWPGAHTWDFWDTSLRAALAYFFD